jgi:WD40 repeat protein
MIVSAPMNAVMFNPQGRTLATASADGEVRLWDVATQQQVGAALDAGPGTVTGVAFTPDGKTLATAGPESGIRLWNVFLPSQSVNQVCAFGSKGVIRSQWKTYIPSGAPFRQVCRQ